MTVNQTVACLLAAATSLAMASSSSAQSAYAQNLGTTSSSLVQQSIGFGFTSDQLRRSTFNGIGGGGNGIAASTPSFGGGGLTTKPFANASRGPTVSPYLGLYNSGIIGDEIDNYQAVVRPQLQQQQLNNQFRQQAGQINRQIQGQARALQNQAVLQEQRLNAQFQEIVGQAAFNPTGSQRIVPTGHTTTFGFTGRYYPSRGR